MPFLLVVVPSSSNLYHELPVLHLTLSPHVPPLRPAFGNTEAISASLLRGMPLTHGAHVMKVDQTRWREFEEMVHGALALQWTHSRMVEEMANGACTLGPRELHP